MQRVVLGKDLPIFAKGLPHLLADKLARHYSW
jgi:hypothetical protein